jgi:hypothetical protein
VSLIAAPPFHTHQVFIQACKQLACLPRFVVDHNIQQPLPQGRLFSVHLGLHGRITIHSTCANTQDGMIILGTGRAFELFSPLRHAQVHERTGSGYLKQTKDGVGIVTSCPSAYPMFHRLSTWRIPERERRVQDLRQCPLSSYFPSTISARRLLLNPPIRSAS